MRPEESDTPIGRVLDELGDEFDAALRVEADLQVSESLRAQAGETPMWEALGRYIGSGVTVRLGRTLVAGTLIASNVDYCAVQAADADLLVHHVAGVSVGLAPDAAATVSIHSPLSARHRLLIALRDLSRRRVPVRLDLLDGARPAGTIERVGSDYLELAEHDEGEPRRRGAVRGRWLVPYCAIGLVTVRRHST